jgi:hypothetical protein
METHASRMKRIGIERIGSRAQGHSSKTVKI